MVSVKILILLWSINLVPSLLAHFLEEKWGGPLDGGRLFRDGRPLFGTHKTSRGLVAGIVTAALVGLGLGFPLGIGLAAGILSMIGDLLTSFIKRRFKQPSGNNVPAFDQVFEGTLPFLVLAPYLHLNAPLIILNVLVFSLGAYVGSHLLKQVLRTRPYANYPRPVKSSVRLRELRRCQVQSNPWQHLLNLKSVFYYHLFMKTVFKLTGIEVIGKKNALDIQTRRLDLHFPDLPEAFDGYTILFLTDLHLDGLDGLTERLLALIRPLSADLCLLGGDYRMDEYGSFAESLRHMQRLIPAIRARDGIYGVLGNHDCLEMVEPMRPLGIRFLLNEAVSIRKTGGDRISIVGVDDPHFYCCDNLEEAFRRVNPNGFNILLAHSPEIYRQASAYRPRLYLCGHTHAGQIQLPGIGPISTHMRGPRFVCQGQWNYNGMKGYTSAGVGVSGAPVRLWSRGEVVLVTLRGSANSEG